METLYILFSAAGLIVLAGAVVLFKLIRTDKKLSRKLKDKF